jgi:glucosamine 6-phosphate synthetase-like amidotransferase/phosphosugar isomerase protein
MLKLDPVLFKKNQQAEISSYLIAADEIEKSLGRNREELARVARFLKDYAPDRLLLLGSGASWVTLYTGYYFLQTSTSLPVTHRFGPEFLADEPRGLSRGKTAAILASYSGNTADTVNAARECRARGYPTVAICRTHRGKLMEQADHLITYESVCLYTSAMANLLWLLAEYAELRGERAEAARLKQALERLPGQLRGCLARSEEVAEEAIGRLKDDTFFYVLGDGAVWALAYQWATPTSWSTARSTPPACAARSGGTAPWRCCPAPRPWCSLWAATPPASTPWPPRPTAARGGHAWPCSTVKNISTPTRCSRLSPCTR